MATTQSASTTRASDGAKLTAMGPVDTGRFVVWDHENAKELGRYANFDAAKAAMARFARQ